MTPTVLITMVRKCLTCSANKLCSSCFLENCLFRIGTLPSKYLFSVSVNALSAVWAMWTKECKPQKKLFNLLKTRLSSSWRFSQSWTISGKISSLYDCNNSLNFISVAARSDIVFRMWYGIFCDNKFWES